MNQQKVFSPIVWIAHENSLSGANLSLLEFMLELREAGAEQLLVVNLPGSMAQKAKELGFEVRFIKFYGWVRRYDEPFFNNGFWIRQIRNIVAFFQFVSLYRSYQPQLVVSFTSTTYIGALAARFLGIRHFRRISEFGMKDFKFRFAWGKWAYRFMNVVSEKVMVNSRAVYDEYSPHIIPRKLVVVYNPVNLNHVFHFENKSIDPIKPRLLLMGQVLPSKGHMDALRALLYLREKSIFPTLTIAGVRNDPAYAQALRAFVVENDLQQQVSFLDFTNDRESLLRNHDVLLMCSAHEAFGRVTAEAMKAYLPVVGAKEGGTKELIIDQVTGLLYTPGVASELADKIALYCKGEVDIGLITKNAYTHITHLTAPEQRLRHFCQNQPIGQEKPLIIWQAHESELTGANIAMLEYIEIMQKHYRFCVVVPFRGSFSLALVTRNIPVFEIKQYHWGGHSRNLRVWDQIRIWGRSVWGIIKWIRIIHKMKPALVFTNTILPYTAAFAAWLTGKKHVWWVHEFGEEDFGITIGWGKNERGYKWMQRTSKLVIANSKAVADKYKACLPDTRVENLYQPVSWKESVLCLPRKAARFLMLGQISPVKGHMDVLEAFAIAKERSPQANLTLHIVGPSENKAYLEALQERIKSNQLEQVISVKPGFMPKEMVLPCYETLIVASNCEAFGRVIVEAQKAGLDVIARNKGGAPELLINQQPYLFDTVEDLVALICNYTPSQRKNIHIPYCDRDEIEKLNRWLAEI